MNVPVHVASWFDHAACAGLDPDLFFPDAGASTKEAKAICATCPVKTECLDYALEHGERAGIWGGTTARQRKQIRATRPRRPGPGTTHGTRAGYEWHLNHHETPCWACADAHSRYLETTLRLWREQRR